MKVAKKVPAKIVRLGNVEAIGLRQLFHTNGADWVRFAQNELFITFKRHPLTQVKNSKKHTAFLEKTDNHGSN